MDTKDFVCDPTHHIRTNRCNWSGRSVDVPVDVTRQTWRYEDYDLYLVFERHADKELAELLGRGVYRVYEAGRPDHLLVTVTLPCPLEVEGDREAGLKAPAIAYSGAISEYSTVCHSEQFDAGDPAEEVLAVVEAAVRVLCNII